jgi:hypothetical protein
VDLRADDTEAVVAGLKVPTDRAAFVTLNLERKGLPAISNSPDPKKDLKLKRTVAEYTPVSPVSPL